MKENNTYHSPSINQKAADKIREIYNSPNWKSNVDERLRFEEYVIPEDENVSLEQLIQWYIDKKSKKVRYSGYKLRKVFLTLPPVEQRKVGLALLTGSQADTEWVCKRLNYYQEHLGDKWINHWHPCYTNAVEECWNKYNGTYCGKLMIQFADEEIVRKYIDELIEKDLYFYLCRRFVNRSWFELDIEKLKGCTSINAYLSVMAKTPQGISAEEARTLLYKWIALILIYDGKRASRLTRDNVFWRDKSRRHKVINVWGMDATLYYLLCMNLSQVVNDFLDWDELISDQYIEGLDSINDSNTKANEERFRNIILQNFPEDMKYLLYINSNSYIFINSPGQPLMKPQLLDESRDNNAPIYLSEEESEKLSSEFERKNRLYERPKDEFDTMLDKNPNFKKLVAKLDLTPTTIWDIYDNEW